MEPLGTYSFVYSIGRYARGGRHVQRKILDTLKAFVVSKCTCTTTADTLAELRTASENENTAQAKDAASAIKTWILWDP